MMTSMTVSILPEMVPSQYELINFISFFLSFFLSISILHHLIIIILVVVDLARLS